MNELNQLLQRLIDADVEFVMVGGFGAVVHGSSLVTRDLDVCALLTPGNIEKLRNAFHDLHPAHRSSAPRLSFLDVPRVGEREQSLTAVGLRSSAQYSNEFEAMKNRV
ncbi:MAG: hypothetical protein H7Y89_01900 [Steroidobacteraceae bacterium]|nr:hypothetical protein [Steroidobacteraceae bacterium]